VEGGEIVDIVACVLGVCTKTLEFKFGWGVWCDELQGLYDLRRLGLM